MVIRMKYYDKTRKNFWEKLRDRFINMSNSGFKNHNYYVNDKLISEDIKSDGVNLIKILINSNDRNTNNLGYFLDNLYNFFCINFDDELLKIILDNLDSDIFNNPCYRHKLDYLQALSNSCMIGELFNNGQYDLGIKIFKKILSNNLAQDEEFQILTSLLSKNIDNSYYNMFDIVLNSYHWAYQNGSKENVLVNIRKMIILVDFYNVKFIRSNDVSKCDYINNIISINEKYGNTLVIFHEFGHMIDTYLRGKQEVDNDILKKAKVYALKNPSFELEICKLEKEILEAKKLGITMYKESVYNHYGSIQNLLNIYRDYVAKMINNNLLNRIFFTYNFSQSDCDKVINDYQKGCLNYDKLAIKLYNIDYNNFLDKCMCEMESAAVTDIISAVFKTRNLIIHGHSYDLTIAHDRSYYRKNREFPLMEIMANYNVLKVTGKDDLIKKLEDIFGREFIEVLERMYTKDVIAKRTK